MCLPESCNSVVSEAVTCVRLLELFFCCAMIALSVHRETYNAEYHTMTC